MLAAAAGLFSACSELDQMQTYDPADVVAPVLHALPAEIVITAENMGESQIFTWDAADFGVLTQINYSIEASYNDGARLVLFSGLSGTSTEQPYSNINAVLALAAEDGGLGVPTDTPSEVQFYVGATIGTGYEKYYSAPVTVRMTVTSAERTYPTVWVIGDYCGWDHGKSQFLFSFSGDEVNYEGVVDFGDKAANGFKLTGVAGWDDSCNWGLDGDAPAPDPEAATITLISAGSSANIQIYSKRFYRLAFDRSTLTLKNALSFDQIGMIGDFNGWAEDVVMEFDATKQRFWADVEFPADGGFKFRLNGAWDTSFGGSDGLLNSGDNIPATAGKYRVYANLNNSAEMTYELNAADYGQGGTEPEPDPDPDPKAEWYIHGQTVATPEWGATAMESASTNIVAYKAAGVEVAANSEFLFKSGDESQWIGVNQEFAGDASPYPCIVGEAFRVSGDPKVNGLITEAGTYDYWLLPEAGRAYVMPKDAKPEYVPDTWGLVGNISGWGDLGDFAMTEEGAYIVRRGIALTTASEFKIRFNNDWKDDKNYGTESGGTIDINTAVDIITSGGSNNMKVQTDGTYDIYFDLTNSKIYVMTAGKTPADAQ